MKQFTRTVHKKKKMSYNKFRLKNIEKYLKITLQQRAHKPYTLCRQPYCSVEGRISRSTATLRSTGSIDSTGRGIGITPVVMHQSFVTTAPMVPGNSVDIDFGWLCWGLTSQSTIFQSCRDGAIASWVFNQYFRGVKCLAQGHNTAAVGLEPRTSRSGVRHSTTEPPRSPDIDFSLCKARVYAQHCGIIFIIKALLKSWQANVKLPRPSGHENQQPHARGSTSLWGRCWGKKMTLKPSYVSCPSGSGVTND